MEDLVIVGAGGTSQEIVDAALAQNRVAPRWNLLGFVDDDPAKRGASIGGVPVLGGMEDIAAYPAARLIVGIAHYRHPLVRRDVVARLAVAGARFAVIVHPFAVVSPRATLGLGSAVLPGAVIAHNVIIGEHVIVSRHCSIGHDVRVGDYATLAPGAVVSGSVEIGSGAYIGATSAIIDGVVIGEGAVIGMGSVVLRPVAPFATALGVPARVLHASEPR